MRTGALRHRLVWILWSAALAGCAKGGGDLPGDVDAYVPSRRDAGTSERHDAGTFDAGPVDSAAARDAHAPPLDDAGFDSGATRVDAWLPWVDAGADAGHDAGSDSGSDAGDDAGRDAGNDAGRDAGGNLTDGGPCPAGRRPVSGGRCGRVLFSDNFDDGVVDPAWTLYRMVFRESGGHLEVQPMSRPGFSYGHFANGRSGFALLHVGDTAWTSYRVEWRQQAFDASPSFNPYSLGPCYRVPVVLYRVQQYAESWNAPADTAYTFAVHQQPTGCASHGDWGLSRQHAYYIPGTGWSATYSGASYSLATGNFGAMPDGANAYVLEVEGMRTRVWINGVLVVDYTDTAGYAMGGAPISSGGIGFSAAFENLFWLDDLVVTEIPPS